MLWPRWQFLKRNSKVRSESQAHGINERSGHLKYESPGTYQSNVMTKIKVLFVCLFDL
jgi:hypothetical protein